MNALSRRFPEIYRCLLTECPQGRLTLGAGTSFALGAAFWSAAGWDQDPGKMLFLYAFWTQVATLVVYGSIRTSASISDERDAKTWDLQRLTPLTSGDIAGGKLLGAPVYAAFLAAMLLPWAVAGALRASGFSAAQATAAYLQLAATAFMACSLALLASAYSDVSRGGSSATGGALIGLGSLYTLAPALTKESFSTITYAGMAVPYALWMPLATAGFGAWAFAAAKWRIGRDLLEPGRFWRFPAFIAYLVMFVLLFEKSSAYFAVLLPVIATVMAALAEPTTPEAWRRWLAASDWGELLDRTPSWISGSGACLVAALLVTLAPAPADPMNFRRLPLLLVFWLIRDAAFIQACRFSRSRRPEIFAAVFLGLFYLIPSILLSATSGRGLLYLFMPLLNKDVGAVANMLPAISWAGASLAALAFVSRRGAGLKT